MLYALGDFTPLFYALLFASGFFLLTLWLNRRAPKYRWLPCALLLLGAGYCAAEYFGLFGVRSAGAISGNQLAALVMAFILAFAAVGTLLGYFFGRRRKK